MTNNILKRFPLSSQWPTQDPFIFCAFHADNYPGSNDEQGPNETLAGRNIGQDFSNKDGWSMYHGQKVPGFPAHPHCGFETITVVTKGYIDHADSLGSTGRFGEGDAQWMTAGKGVLHSEMFPLLDPVENPLELFQIWLNQPHKDRGVDPHYKMFWKDDIPIFEQDGTKITIIAGNYSDVQAITPSPNSWAIDPLNEVQVWRVELAPGSTFKIPAVEGAANRSLFFFEGETATIGDENLESGHGTDLVTATEITVSNSGQENAFFLFLQGRPIQEEFIRNGPFIAANRTEMHKVVSEYQRTQFGGWEWDTSGPVFGSEKKRFSTRPK